MAFNVYINKKTIPWNDRGFNYGDGVFETLLVLQNKPKYLKEHIERLCRGCSTLNIPKPTINLIRKNIKTCIGNSKECIVKIILTRGISDFGYKIDTKEVPCIYFFKIKFNIRQAQLKKKNIKLGFSKYFLKDNNELSKVKHLGRLEQICVAQDLLKQKKVDDLIVLDKNDNIIECLSSNIFFVKGKSYETPKIMNCGIEGVLRNKVISHLRSFGRTVKITTIDKNKLNLYSHCFTTNSVQGLIFIDQVGRKKFSKPENFSLYSNFIYNKGI
ncbi:MAG: aminodeoxychorismate lyase [Pseudomonadota bacterium]|nr:aminodeoxychorismate lyase [Pseudomonadota bacterium]